ncbi:hypothetical protein [Actinoplanes derwentensis]|uniref:Heparinase II/III-like protein n=1 Tax=Actinoplanes derwentensis TaxID=113562 RepID=A0A1H1RMD4_9ACTN|nr:hypothetical protein [Actinoplanes derwentensis]GID84467.1 hypothetical protein Ade03nite_33910 [Actinoplanes derwentensis]SDS36865.1 hypothetical protein SAMN04489716_0632 [Actinoplanes derwentensis]
MTDPDPVFHTRVRTALDREVDGILGEDAGRWRQMQHRRLAERVKTLAAGWRLTGDPALLVPARELIGLLRGLQNPSGLFRGGDNVDSPPDSAFSVNDLADAAQLLGDQQEDLADLLESMTPALVKGGVHTPNHRWELSAALARLHRLDPRPELAARVEQWLAEGVDIEDGLWSERSPNYAAHVSNPSLLTIADVFDRPDLAAAVEQNLTATLDLLLPDGTVETVLSRRQDQRWPVPLQPYLLPLRLLAVRRGRGDLAWAAGLALEQGIASAGTAATALLLTPEVGRLLPPPQAPPAVRGRHFTAAGTLVAHGPARTAVVFGGSDHARHQRIRSGLANSPTFLRLYAGRAVLDSARLSRTFFGLGPFRSAGLTVDGDTAVLGEAVSAGYYQPLSVTDRDDQGRYTVGDDGRFSAAMDFAQRASDRVTLTTGIRVTLTETGADLDVDVSGAVVDWSLELAFRPGGTMSGAAALGDDRWQLESGTATYRVAGDALSVTVFESPETPAEAAPGYHPGEEYEFLGGTDAIGGVRLYVTGKAPSRLRLRIAASVN